MTWNEMAETAVGVIPCGYCGATAGHACVTSSGRKATRVHWTRMRPIQQAWADGYQEGEQDLLGAAIDSPEWFARRVEAHRRDRETGVAP